MSFNFKKIFMFNASLMLLGSVGSMCIPASNAKHIHHHNRTVRIVHRHTHGLLTYHQLEKDTDYDYYHSSDKYSNIIDRTVNHNLYHYSNHQLKSIFMNADPNDSPDFDDDILTKMQNVYYNRKSVLKKISNQHSTFNNRFRIALIKDINQTRIANGVSPLKIGGVAQKIADYREPHVQHAYDKLRNYKIPDNESQNPTDKFVHGETNGTSDDDDMYNMNYQVENFAENASNWSPSFNNSNCNAQLKYKYDTPSHIAYNTNDLIVNHDNTESNHNTHRYIELNPQFHYIGVGVSYNPKTNVGAINEQYLS